jgi:membrane-associated phospholipid phosphatase
LPSYEQTVRGRFALMIETKTHRATAATRRKGGVDRFDVPVLDARTAGPAEKLARAFGGLHPALVFAVVMFGALAGIAALSIGCGLLVTRVIEHASHGASGEAFDVWLANHRTPARTEASLIGSIVAGGVVLPIVAGSIAVACAIARKWRLGAFVVFALGVESASYRITTLVVHSHRPRVVRLETLPVNASYPSGHTAAAIAVYGGIVLLLTSKFTNRVFRAYAWMFALAMVAFVALARMYRGMHHPLDVAGGVVIGIAAVIALVFACRTSDAAAESRKPGRARGEGAA